MSVTLYIERKAKHRKVWEVIGYPRNNVPEAKTLLERLRKEERIKKFKGDLRLVRVTREIL